MTDKWGWVISTLFSIGFTGTWFKHDPKVSQLGGRCSELARRTGVTGRLPWAGSSPTLGARVLCSPGRTADEARESEEGTRHCSPMAGLVLPWESVAAIWGLLLHLLQPFWEKNVGRCVEQGLLLWSEGLAMPGSSKQSLTFAPHLCSLLKVWFL